MRIRIGRNQIPLLVTTLVCLLLYGVAAIRYPGFFSPGVFINFFTDNAVLGIVAIGLTFVILSGGIDLSVGAVVGLTSTLIATLMDRHHFHPFAAIATALLAGLLLGTGMGLVIQCFNLPPFLVTLAGMFMARGIGFLIRFDSIPITHPVYERVSDFRLHAGFGTEIPATALLFLLTLAVAMFIAHCTRFGRYVYALGSNEQSALLMGLPVSQTRVAIYALSGFCSAFDGVVYTFYTVSGNPTAGSMLELDAIASVVIGGTLLTGGVGYVIGTLIGVLIFGIIQTAITFQGTLSSWWTKIAIGLLLLLFILMQKVIRLRHWSKLFKTAP